MELLWRHPKASVFHTPAWLETLWRTYGYELVGLTTSRPGSELANGLVFCRVKSWLTGERMVSLPFTDHCHPLFDNQDDFYALIEHMVGESHRKSNRYLELRPITTNGLDLTVRAHLHPTQAFRLHILDLQPNLSQIFRSFNKDSIQRGIRRAEGENLRYEEGRSPELLRRFYTLQLLTRRRHRLPPQPIEWFANLLYYFGEDAKIRSVSFGNDPVAAILTLNFRNSVVYKYGASDLKYNHLRGTTLLFWRTIQESKESGASLLDMGRSAEENEGLIAFKSKWGSSNLPLRYWRYPAPTPRFPVLESGISLSGKLLCRLPDKLLIVLGKTLYKHAG